MNLPKEYVHFVLLISFTCSSIFVSGGISITKLNIPRYVYMKQNVTLNCNFELDGSELYSMKWYKDNQEIYRYIPRYKPPVKIHNTKGVILDVLNSRVGSILIIGAVQDTSGTYACEISGEGPDYPTKYIEKEMTIVEVPKEKPRITGIRTNYKIGDTVSVNCTSPVSIYETKLTWFINNRKVRRDLVEEGEMHWYKNGSQRSSIGLNFAVRRRHVRSGLIKIKCKAVIASSPSLYTKYSQKILIIKQQKDDAQSSPPIFQNNVFRSDYEGIEEEDPAEQKASGQTSPQSCMCFNVFVILFSSSLTIT